MKSIITSLIAIGCLFSSLPASAKVPTAPKPAPKATPSPTPQKHHTVISSVSADSITVDTGRSTQTYKIEKTTHIFFEGKAVPASELKTGMGVAVTPGGFDGKLAATIIASNPPKK